MGLATRTFQRSYVSLSELELEPSPPPTVIPHSIAPLQGSQHYRTHIHCERALWLWLWF